MIVFPKWLAKLPRAVPLPRRHVRGEYQ